MRDFNQSHRAYTAAAIARTKVVMPIMFATIERGLSSAISVQRWINESNNEEMQGFNYPEGRASFIKIAGVRH